MRKSTVARRLFGLLAAAGLVLSVAPAVFADAGNPITVDDTGSSGNTLVLQGTWDWNKCKSNVGWAIDWDDPNFTGNPITVGSTTLYMGDAGPYTGTGSGQQGNHVFSDGSTDCQGLAGNLPGIIVGTWGPLSHTYANAEDRAAAEPCVVIYDLHSGYASKAKETTAGGANHNKDNSFEKNYTKVGNCQKIERPREPLISVSKSADKTLLDWPGGNVTFEYEVTNAGNVPLENISVTDNKCSPVDEVLVWWVANWYNVGDTDYDWKLDLTEEWEFTCTTNVGKTTTNTATACGSPVIINESGPQTGQPVPVCNTDDETVVVKDPPLSPALTVTKSANPTTLPAGGGSVTYSYTLYNGGNVVLAMVWTDDKCAPVTYVSGDSGDGLLQPGETWNLTCTTTIAVTTTNTIVATGTGAQSQSVKGQASATVTVLPAVSTPAPTPKASIQGATSRPNITLPPTDSSAPGGSNGGGDGLPIVLLLLVGIAAFAPIVVKANWKSHRS